MSDSNDEKVIPLWYEWGWLPAVLILSWWTGAPDFVGYMGLGVLFGMLIGDNHAR